MYELFKNKWVVGIAIMVILTLILCYFLATFESNDGTEVQVAQQASTVENSEPASQQVTQEDATETSEGYFLVKADDDGNVKVFWIDAGGEHLHQETTIAFSLLSVEDQELLRSGVELETEQDLAGFLENFDS